MIDDIRSLAPQLVKEARDRNQTFSLEGLLQALKFIPNSRFAYYNRLLRDGIARRKFSQDDIDFVDTVWMNGQTKSNLKDFMRCFLQPEIRGYTVRPTFSKSGVALEGAPGDRLALRLSNPGTLYFPTSMAMNDDMVNLENYSDVIVKMVQNLDREILRIQDNMALISDMEPVYNVIQNNEVQKTLIWAQDKLLDKHMRYEDVVKLSEALHRLVGIKRSKYFLSLSNPFKHRGARIPTLISPPSATFSVRSVIPLTTNASGNVAFALNPTF